MIFLNILLFIISLALLLWAGSFLVSALMRIAKFLGWREFVVAFFVIAFASTIPNFFIGISSALHKIPQLSFGDVVGGNLVDLTLAVALATLFAKTLPTKSRLVQASSFFTIIVALLPLLLILDGTLGRGDGLLLIFAFFFYIFWLFSKKERFTKVYEDRKDLPIKGFIFFFKDLVKVIIGIGLLLIAAECVVRTLSFIARSFNWQLSLLGILIVGLGNALPETYFAIASARKGQNWMILGNLMGSIIAPATLVLGTVALISPIVIPDFSPFVIARVFLIIAALLFFFFIRTGREVTRREAIFLLFLYILFVILEISFH